MDERSVKLKFINEVTDENKLKNYEKRLQNIRKLMSSMPSNVKIGEEIKNIGNEAEKTNKKLSSAFDKTKFVGFVIALKKAATVMTELISKSSSYLENINLYQVAFNGAYQEADRFVNKITEMYGLDESWAVKTVGIFRQLANAMGMATEQANELSYLMTQMSVDISSLYNVDISRASQVLQSALAGQTRPIRSVTGADITMNTLQQTLNQLGIDRAINSLSFAEKRMVIIISLVQQLQQATNDFGRTLESPANQMRILNEQWQRLTRAVGNVFLPLLSKILPYLNAILMVLTEIISAVAALFGYKEEDYDYFSGMADSVLDLEEGLDGATESAKKLKQGLRGFDKLNVITTPTSTSGGASVSGGISTDILKAYDDAYASYMSKLDKVQMKATKIRDKIMEWLGFTKKIDETTGDVSFKYEGLNSKLLNVLSSFHLMIPSNFKGIISGIKIFKSIISWFKDASVDVENIDKLSGISDDNLKRLKPIQEAFENLKTTISSISYDNLAITPEEQEKIENSINELTNTLKTSLQEYVNEQLLNLNYLYKEMGIISEEEYNKRLEELNTFQQNENQKIEQQSSELKEQYKNIYDENGNIIMSAYADYLRQLDEYENQSYQKLSIGEENKKKLEENAINLSKQERVKYYSDMLKGYIDDKNNQIEAAKEKKEKTIKALKELYGESSEQYKLGLEKAEKTYQEEVTKAETAYNDIYSQFVSTQEDIAQYIDKDTGGILTKFQIFWNKLKSFFTGGLKLTVTYDTNVGKIKTAVYQALGLDGWPKLSFSSYAQGGLPPVGQMFIANERGPELLGQIGGHSFVANQNQMLGIIRDEIHSRTNGINNATIIVQVDSDEVARHTITNLEDMSKSNGRPFVIGG